MLIHNLIQRPQSYPPLIQRDAMLKVRVHLLQRPHISELKLILNQAHHHSRTLLPHIRAAFKQIGHEAQGPGAHLYAQIAVEWRGHASLLHVAQNVHAHRELTLRLLPQQILNELGRVVPVGELVPYDHATLDSAAHLALQVMELVDDLVDGEGLFVNEGMVGARRQR